MQVDLGGPSAAQDVVGGRYRLLELLGAGGMGRVWKADDQLLHREVAIKEISTPTEVSTSEMLDRQFATMREARAAARLDHPGVIKIFDVVWRPGRSWIVMEYVPSRSLHEALVDDGPLSHQAAARVGLGILSALRAAHGAGVLHRDVKPQNVLLATDGRVVLTDFGLATFDQQPTGEPEPLVGSPYYVAPERLHGEPSSERSDLWSLGATLYSAIEGRPPFKRETTTRSLTALAVEPPDPMTRPGPLSAVLKGLLVKDPAQRMSADQLEPLLRKTADRAIGVFPMPRPKGDPLAARSARIALAAAIVLIVGTTGAALAVGRGASSAPAVSASASAAAVAGVGTQCGPAGGGIPVAAGPAQTDYDLPDGWTWHVDASGARVAVPRGWSQIATGNVTCFWDPESSRSLTVDTGARLVGSATTHWADAESASSGSLPGYQRVALTTRPDGAEWEYTWQPAGQLRQHETQTLISVGSGRTFAVDWQTTDQDWSINLPYLRLVLASLR
jgi:hypothetical protein